MTRSGKTKEKFPLGITDKRAPRNRGPSLCFTEMDWMSWLWNVETEAHSLTLQLICRNCSQNALLCKSVLQAEPKARSLCPRTLSLAFLFRRCQLLRGLAVVLLRIASLHWQLNLALQSKSTQAAWAWSQGCPASHALLLLCRAAAACDHAWTQSAAKLTILPCFTMLPGSYTVFCRAQNKFRAPLPTWGSTTSPHSLFCTATPPQDLTPFKIDGLLYSVESQTWTREGNPIILWLSWYLGHANLLPKLWKFSHV